MDPLVRTWTVNQQVASADLNAIQQALVALRPTSGTATNDWSSVANGMQGGMYQDAGSLANATVATLDTSIDWRDRIVFGSLYRPGAAASQPGGANDTNYETGSGTWNTFMFYTGTGATDAGAALVTDGNPPAIGYYVQPVANFSVFCDTGAGGGKLRIYNGTGAAIDCLGLFVFATADLGKR